MLYGYNATRASIFRYSNEPIFGQRSLSVGVLGLERPTDETPLKPARLRLEVHDRRSVLDPFRRSFRRDRHHRR